MQKWRWTLTFADCFTQGMLWAMVLRVGFASSVVNPGIGRMHARIRDSSASIAVLPLKIGQMLQSVILGNLNCHPMPGKIKLH